MEVNFNIKYHDANMPKLERIGGDKSNWTDLRACSIKVIGQDGVVDYGNDFSTVEYKMGDTVVIDFGISIDMTDNKTGKEYVGNISPRSSTFKNFGLFLTNSVGRIDTVYAGDNDHWMGQFLAMRDGSVSKYDRVAQFDVREQSPLIKFTEVETLGKNSRGSYGSTGVK